MNHGFHTDEENTALNEVPSNGDVVGKLHPLTFANPKRDAASSADGSLSGKGNAGVTAKLQIESDTSSEVNVVTP